MPGTTNARDRNGVRGIAVVMAALAAFACESTLATGQLLDGAVGGKVAARVERPLSEENRKHIAELDSPVLRTRESAMVALRASPLLTLGQLEAVLASEKLSAEQFNRVCVLAKEQFTRTPRAALGVQFDDAGARSSEGVPIARTIAGFDSERVLKAGDVMYAMSGVRVMSLEDARKIITSHDPGERMTIHLFRQGEPLIVRATLGDFADLDGRPGRGGGGMGFAGNRGMRGYDVTDAAWEIRLARVMGEKLDKSAAIDPGLGAAEYAAMESQVERVVENQEKRDKVKTVAKRETHDAGEGGEQVIVAGGGAGGQVGLEAAGEFGRVGGVGANDEATLQAQRNQLQMELNNINMMMMQQQLEPKKRQTLAAQSIRIRTLLMDIDGKLAREKMNRMAPPPKP